MLDYYDIALLVYPDVTISQLRQIAKQIYSLGVGIDWPSAEIGEYGLYLVAQYPNTIKWRDLEKGLSEIDGLVIDYETMRDWDE